MLSLSLLISLLGSRVTIMPHETAAARRTHRVCIRRAAARQPKTASATMRCGPSERGLCAVRPLLLAARRQVGDLASVSSAFRCETGRGGDHFAWVVRGR